MVGMRHESRKVEFREEEVEDALKLLVALTKKCLMLGGVPYTRTRYAGMPFEENGKLGIMFVCAVPLRAERMDTVTIFVDRKSEDWSYLWRHLDTHVGDWRDIVGRYGFLVPRSEVDKILERYGIRVWGLKRE